MSEQNNIAATVFVFEHRKTGDISAHYLNTAKSAEANPDLKHVASLEPRLWIQSHWKTVEAANREVQE